jgi:hypothetical protein
MPHEVPVDCRPFVLGLAHGQSGQCGFIKDPNLQAQCRAGSGGGSGQCGFIRDSDMQAACRARFG